MYINKKYRNFLITVNIIFIIFSVFNLIISVPYIVSKFVYYKDDINTALQAKSMASSIKFTIISIILLIIVYKIKNKTVIELNSKKCLCICKSCDTQIEAKEYFTGICPYCNSSDLNAKVISGNRFYSISNDFKNGINNSNHYTCKNIS